MAEGQKSAQPLDDEQLTATQAPERAIAVLAGPGSGKTRVLSFRARHLLKGDGRSKALLLTFTNKAVAEMKSRPLKAAAVASNRIVASTFHAFAQGVLRAHGDLAGIPTEFEILDREDQKEMCQNAAQQANLKNHGSEWSKCRVRREKPPSRRSGIRGDI
jgi:DNA helicase-2/ATP-dependent DNA helicase PcrA